MERDDREYVVRVLHGDKDAYGALVDAYQGMVFATALNITGNYSDSEDIVQEVFLRAYQRLRALSDPSKFAPWLHTIAKRIALQFLREKRRIPVADSERILADRFQSDAESAVEAYARKELNGILWNQVAELPPKAREAILLYYMEGFSIKRAAAFLGITEGAMKMRLSFGREKLRESLMQKIEGELREHQPSRKIRNAILAALPVGGVPPVSILGLGAAKGALPLLALSAKQMATIAGIVVAGLATTLFLRSRSPQPPAPQVPPVSVEQQEERADTSQTELLPAPAEQMVGAQGHAVRGWVVERLTDEPISGVTVCLDHEERRIEEATTDAQGEFELVDLADGRYALYVGVRDRAVLEGYYLPQDAESIEVNLSGQDVENLTLSLYRGTYLSGIVVDQDNRPVEGASLRLEHYRHSSLNPYAQSEPDGRFEFGGVFPGRIYTIVCETSGYAPAKLEGLKASLGRPLGDLIIRLVEGGGASVSGRVIDLSGQPVESALVIAHSGFDVEFRRDCLTDPNGGFSFHDVPPGNVGLDALLYDERQWFVVKPNEVIEGIEFVVDCETHSGYVSGVIVDASGQSITEAIVHAQPTGKGPKKGGPWQERYSPGDDIAATVPDEEGAFKLANLKPGTAVDILYQGPSGPRQATSATNIPVPTEDVVAVFESAEPERPTLTVRGRVADKATRQPIEQFAVSINLNNISLRSKRDQRFDAQGRFEIEDVRYLPGRTYLYAEADGYAPQFVRVTAREGAEEVNVDVYLGVGGSIEGRVVNMQDQPVQDAQVFLWDEEGRYTLTDAGGAFRLAGIRELRDICVRHPDYAPYVGKPYSAAGRALSFLAGGSASVKNCVIRLTQGGTIAGTVSDDAGEPILGACIMVYANSTRYAYTHATGAYEVGLLPPQTYTVSHRSTRYEMKKVAVVEGETTWVDFGPSGSTLFGTVFFQGRPSPSVLVGLSESPFPLPDSFQEGCYTDRTGAYAIHDAPAGTHHVVVFDGRKRLASESVEMLEGQDLEHDIFIECGSISGTVVQRDRTPVADVYVLLFEQDRLSESFMHLEVASGAVVTDAQGRFQFDAVPAGEYLIQAQSDTLGKAAAEVELEVGQSIANVVLSFGNTGSLEVRTVHAGTGEELALSGMVFLLDEQGRISTRDVRGRFEPVTTPVTLEGIDPGIYYVGAGMEDENNRDYCSPMQAGVSIMPNVASSVVLRMRPVIKTYITVVDSEGMPVTGFQALAYTLDDARILILGTEANRFSAITSRGEMRLIITKDGETLYDGILQIEPAQGETTFELTIALDGTAQ